MRTARQHISRHNYEVEAAPLQAVLLPLKWYLMHIGVIFQCFTLNILQMFKVHMHVGALRMLLNGCVYVWDIIHLSSWIIFPYKRTDHTITYT